MLGFGGTASISLGKALRFAIGAHLKPAWFVEKSWRFRIVGTWRSRTVSRQYRILALHPETLEDALLKNEILINVGPGEIRVASVEEERLCEVHIERRSVDRDQNESDPRSASVLNNIFLGRVQRVLPGMQAAFVDVGLARAGFLGAREAQCLAEMSAMNDGQLPPISACVREGETILVQVVKDPMSDKGARLSANVTLPGRLLVYVPNQAGVGMSRRIEDEAERARLTSIIEKILSDTSIDGGFIVRTAAMGLEEDVLREDAEQLAARWKEIEQTKASLSPPSLVHEDVDPISRVLRDAVNRDTHRVQIDNLLAFKQAQSFRDEHLSDQGVDIVFYQGPGSLFDQYEIESQLEACFDPQVSLPSGGWITIETTEALTAIDVNSGSLTEETGLEATSVRTNIEAADEIGRQLRLRGIGGLIVVDFIHMDLPENNERVVEHLERGLVGDRVPFQVSAMSEFGLVEMTRKRVREPLSKMMTEGCRTCEGSGRLHTAATVANSLLRSVERAAREFPGKPLKAVASSDVIKWIEAREEGVRAALAEKGISQVVFERQVPSPRDRFHVHAMDEVVS